MRISNYNFIWLLFFNISNDDYIYLYVIDWLLILNYKLIYCTTFEIINDLIVQHFGKPPQPVPIDPDADKNKKKGGDAKDAKKKKK